MKRSEHTFQFPGKRISAAAAAEHTYHTERGKWWEAEQGTAIAKAKTAGVEIREYDVTGGKRADVILDPSVAARLTECANKIQTHRRAADQFQIEAAAYGTQPERVYDLHPDDVFYFRLAGGARAD
jgi:hypothetical protein